MKLINFIEPEFTFSDDRGWLKQLVSKDWSQVNVISSVKDSFRGGHYHKHNKELFYVINGSFKLDLSKGDYSETHEITMGQMFIIESEILHSFTYLEDTLMVSMYDEGVEMKFGKDIFTK